MNLFRKNKSCPHCQKPVKVSSDFEIAAPLFILAIFLNLLLRPIFIDLGLGGPLATGLTTFLLVMLSMRLKAA